MKTLIYFTGNFDNLNQVRQFYYKLALIHHPDRGGDTATMQAINNEYEYLTSAVIAGKYYDNYSPEAKETEIRYSEELQEKISQVLALRLQAVKIEVIGSWIWITGMTKPVKDQLKEISFRFSAGKTAWYWHAPGYHKKSRRRFELDEVRTMFGSTEVEQERQSALR